LGGRRHFAQYSTAQLKTNFAECRPFRVREPQTPVRLCPQDAIFRRKVLVAKKQLLVDASADVGQDACLLHKFVPSAHHPQSGRPDPNRMVADCRR
jgi:hypothetical protein